VWEDLPLFPESASSLSGEVDALYVFLIAVSAFFALLICALVVGFTFKYRRRPGNERASRIEGSLALELAWTLIPLAITMVIFVWGARLYFALSLAPEDCLEIQVIGKQWMWKLQHPQGQREINELHIPLGRPVRLTMTSEDVIHSFFVPAFRTKMDVLPNRYSSVWFEPTRTGRYHLFCAEYCGTKHSEMIGTVHVLEPHEYERWLRGAVAGEAPAEAGRRLYEAQRCDTCHFAGPEARGPVLAGLFGRRVQLADGSTVVVDENHLRESIVAPNARLTAGWQAIMPTYAGLLREEEILQLLAYIKSLPAPEVEPRNGDGR